MKNLLFISINDHSPWGGSEELWSQVAQKLIEKESKVFCLVADWNPEPKHVIMLRHCGIEVIKKKKAKQKNLLTRIIQKLIKPKRMDNGSDLAHLVKTEKIDITFLSLGYHADISVCDYTEILSQKGIDYALIVQLATDLRDLNDKSIKRLSESYRKAKKVFVLSENNVTIIETQLGLVLNNKEFINNPFNYNQDIIPYSGSEDSYQLGLVANLNIFHKAQNLLFYVLSLPYWEGKNIHINVYGNGINKELLMVLVEQYQLEKKITFHGFEADKSKIWSKNHACIMISRMEGQSLAILEAMSFGRMVISTEVGDAKRLIEDGISGYLIPATTTDLIHQTLQKAWENRSNWLEMGVKARRRLSELIHKDPVDEFAEKIEMLL